MSKIIKFIIVIYLTIPLVAWEYYSNGVKRKLVPVTPIERFQDHITYFRNYQGVKLGVDHRIVFYPKSNECFEKIRKQYSYHYEKIDKYFILFVKNPKEAFDVANAIYESGCVFFSHPDFIVLPKKRLLDPLFDPQQWNFYNYGQFYSKPDIDLNVYEAWLYGKGAGVKVAIIDDAFDVEHEDLKDAFVNGYNVVYRIDNIRPDNKYEFHGTLCAGLIGARENGVGIMGVAPEAQLFGIKLLLSDNKGEPLPLYTSDIVKAFLIAEDADVINCSWGTYNVADDVRSAIDYLAIYGRKGKGIPIVFASGNDGMPQYYWEHDESALNSVIAVGGVTNLGEHPWYSNYGSYLDFVAPSGGGTLAIATTDMRGSSGLAKGFYGHPDYAYASDMTGFNGTSAAAPQISGVIALMLERNPDLTRDQIYDILARTAKKVGDIPYIDGRNDFFGYGLVDAEAAVKEAIRLKVESIVKGQSYEIAGYFSRIGSGKFDWIYVSGSMVAKLDGMDEDGHLIWDPVLSHAFDTIRIEDGSLLFGSATSSDPLALRLAQKRLSIEGFFVHYGIGSYDWIYVARSGRSYKLEGLSYNDDFLWVPLQLRGVKQNDMIRFE